MTTLKIIDYKKGKSTIAKNYYGKYISTLSEKEYNRMFKDYVVFQLEDNNKVAVEFNYDKPKKTIYYDDETPRPEVDLDYFVYYNMRFQQKADNFSNDYQLYLLQDNNDKDNKRLLIGRLRDTKDYGGWYDLVRELTDAEINFMKEYAKEQDQKYKKRLTTYYKRYKDIIYTSGYWANR